MNSDLYQKTHPARGDSQGWSQENRSTALTLLPFSLPPSDVFSFQEYCSLSYQVEEHTQGDSPMPFYKSEMNTGPEPGTTGYIFSSVFCLCTNAIVN